jgi:hypothetical protein
MELFDDAEKSQDVFRGILLKIDEHLDRGETVEIELKNSFLRRLFYINSETEKQEFIKQLGLM